MSEYPAEPTGSARSPTARLGQHPAFSRSCELEHLFENSLDCLFGLTGGYRIVADVHAVNDARVRIGEWLLSVGVYEEPIRLLLDLAIAHTLESRLQRCRLRTQRVVECVRGVWILGQLNIRAGGSLTLVSGFLSVRPRPNSAIVGSANGALESLSRALALELAPIRVNAVSPGVISTPMHAREAHGFLAGLQPMGRMGKTQEVVDAVMYLENASFVTGEILHVDGGWSAGRIRLAHRSSATTGDSSTSTDRTG